MLRLQLCCGALLVALTAAQTYYVAVNGSDATGDGSPSQPWATMQHAQAAIRPLLPGMTQDIVVYLRQGTYSMLTSGVTFEPSDSGTGGHSVTYAAYPGEVATLSGGQPVSGWTLLNATAGLWSATLPVAAGRQLFVDDARVNETNLGDVDVYGSQLLSDADTIITATGYLTNNSALVAAAQHPLQRAADVEFLYRMVGCQWVEDRVRVAEWSLSSDGITLNITFVQPGWYMVLNKPYKDNFPSHVINLVSTLLAPTAPRGTGMLSATDGVAYYLPLPGQDMSVASAVVAMLDAPLISLVGDRNASPAIVRVHDLNFNGLVFAHTTWNAPSGDCAYIPDQSGIIFNCSDGPTLPSHATNVIPGAVEVHTGGNITIANCSFLHNGRSGVTVDDGSQDISISRSVFLDSSCHAARFGQVDDVQLTDVTRQNARFTFSDNLIVGTGMEYRDCAAVMGGFTKELTVQHNTIRNASWAGITIGWGWGGYPDGVPTVGNTRILSNDVQYVNLLTADGGPIYVLGPSANSEMALNFVGHARHHAALLYHDEGSCGWYTHDCVVNEPPGDMVPNGGWWYSFLAAWAGSEHDIRMERFFTNLARMDIYNGNNLTVSNVTLLNVTDPWPPAAQAIMQQAGITWQP